MLQKKYTKNKLTLSTSKKIFIYHSFDGNKYSGRWYNTDLLKNGKFKLDQKKRIFTYIIPEWEKEIPKYHVIKNVPIKIYFSDNGWNKFTNIISGK